MVNEDVCNGNGHCVPACPFGVIALQRDSGIAAKCTFCYDRVAEGMETACAQVCPTDCIEFGAREVLVERAEARVGTLRERGEHEARLYGKDELGGLGVLYVLTRQPGKYGLPDAPTRPALRIAPGFAFAAAMFLALAGVWGLFSAGSGS